MCVCVCVCVQAREAVHHGNSLHWRYVRTRVFCIGVGLKVEGPVTSLHFEVQNKPDRATILPDCVTAIVFDTCGDIDG